MFFCCGKGSAHIIRDSKALFIATLSCGWGGATSASEHVSALITKSQNTNMK